MQLSLNFTTQSKINVERLKGQNKRLYDYLLSGKSIHVCHPAKMELRIGYLNSRISDLVNRCKVDIDKKTIKVVDAFGELVDVVEYSLKPFA